MKDFMPQHQQSKKLVENVLQVSAAAREAKKNNKDVINATAGSYYTEDGNIKVFEPVKNHFENPNYNQHLSYASVGCSANLKKAIFEWVLGENNLETYKDYYQDATPTPGGTGAISMALATYLEEGEGILLPNLMWPAYVQIANNIKVEANYYNLYNEKREFDLNSLEEQIIKSQEKYGKVFIVVNDPCHNPTGFVMSNDEYKGLVALLNKHSVNSKIILLMDIAYLDYGKETGDFTRSNFKELSALNDNVKVLFAFSASKTFGIYGLRLGALLHITKNEEEAIKFTHATHYHARSTWSNSSHLAMNIIEDTFTNIDKKNAFKVELALTSKNLSERANKFTPHLDKYNVPYAPYQSGFFILLLIDNPYFDRLLEEQNIYGVRFGKNYRIALSSINLDEAGRLGEIVGKTYLEIQKA